MRVKLPMKSRLVLRFEDGPLWEREAISAVLADEGVDSDYWRCTARFWLIEMTGNGVLEVLDVAMDDGYYGGDREVYRYGLTDLGRSRIRDLLR